MGKHLHGHIAETIRLLLDVAGLTPDAISIEGVTLTFNADILLRDGKHVEVMCHGDGPQQYTYDVRGRKGGQ